MCTKPDPVPEMVNIASIALGVSYPKAPVSRIKAIMDPKEGLAPSISEIVRVPTRRMPVGMAKQIAQWM